MQSAALARYVSECSKPLRKYLNKRGVRPWDIDDISQEVWMRLSQYGKEDQILNPLPFVIITARNVLFARYEMACNSKPHEVFEDHAHEMLIEHNEGELDVINEQRQKIVSDAIAQLTPRQQTFLMLQGRKLTYKAIAEATGTTCRMVLRDLNKAKCKLRGLLNRDELHD